MAAGFKSEIQLFVGKWLMVNFSKFCKFKALVAGICGDGSKK